MTTALRNKPGLAFLFPIALAVAACGGAGGDDDSATVLITAAEGGSIEIDGTDTRVVIPADALGEDTEITISMGHLADYGAADDARDGVLVFSPDGIVLSRPAEITLNPGDPAVDGTELVSILQFVDGGWYPPEVSSAAIGSGGLVGASVSVLAPVAVVIKEAPQGPTGSIRGGVLHIYTEAPLAGIGFELKKDGVVLGTATSDTAGAFRFDGIGVGAYTVHSTIDSADNCYGDPVDKDATVTEDSITDVYFGFVPRGRSRDHRPRAWSPARTRRVAPRSRRSS